MRGGGSFDDKYKKVYALLAERQEADRQDQARRRRSTASTRSTSIGAIVGEHTYNVDVFDTLQGYYVKALQYADNKSLAFALQGQTAAAVLRQAAIRQMRADEDQLRALGLPRRRSGTGSSWARSSTASSIPDDRFARVFFQPFFAGQTFGLGQLSPVAALMVTDIVHAKSGLPLLSIDDAPAGLSGRSWIPTSSLHLHRGDYPGLDRHVQAHRRLRHFEESRAHRDALQSRRCGDARPAAAGDQRRARGEGPAAALPAGELLRLAGQRPRGELRKLRRHRRRRPARACRRTRT